MTESNNFLMERERRMAENRARLEAMGLADMSARMAAMKPVQANKGPKAPRAARRAERQDRLEPGRRSDRNKGKEVNYNERQPLAVYEEREPRRGVKRARRDKDSSGVARGGQKGWHPGIPDAPLYARELALDAALDKIEQLTKNKAVAFAKELMDSMVSGGYWLQAPKGLQQYLPLDTDVTFTTTDTARPADQFRYTQLARKQGERNDAWFVKYLQKRDKTTGEAKGGQGFSANWRGFTCDLFLHSGDYVVFEVVSTTEITVHAFRSWDYAKPEDKPEGFEDIRFTAAAAAASQAVDEAATQQEQAATTTSDKGSKKGDQRQGGAKKQQRQPAGVKKGTSEADEGPAAPGKAQQGSTSSKKLDSSRSKRKKQNSTVDAAPALAATASSKDAVKGSKDQSDAAADAASKRSRKGSSNTRRNSSSNGAAAEKPCGKGAGRRRKAEAAAVAVDAGGGSRKRNRKSQEEFVVDWIVDAKVDEESGQRLYKVRWLGYADPAEDTWQTEDTFENAVRSYDWKIPVPEWVPQ